MIEATCRACGETFTPADETDLVHLTREDGSDCGGVGVIAGRARRAVRAYRIIARGKDGSSASAVLDLLRYPPGVTREQATMSLLTAIIRDKGPQWIDDYEIHEVE